MAYQENIDLDEGAARVIARLADGGMRDGLSLLDQCASATTGELDSQRVYACLGIAGEQRCGEMMGYIADQNPKEALTLFNRLYAEGKDMSALLDELACLTRDLLVLKTAPDSGLTMLSGVASDGEAQALSKKISTGELVRYMGRIEKTLAGFTRSSSRRMDAELCILELCRPELSLEADALNARLTRLEEQLKSGKFVVNAVSPQVNAKPVDVIDEELPPLPDDGDAPPDPDGEPEAPAPGDEAPMGFWSELVGAVHRELKPPLSGFFVATENAPVRGTLKGNRLDLMCSNSFIKEMIDKPQILEVVSRKASAQLGRPVNAFAVDGSRKAENNAGMNRLLDFAREHPDIVTVKK